MVLISEDTIEMYEAWGQSIHAAPCSECRARYVYATHEIELDIWPVTCTPCFALREKLSKKEW